MEWTKIIYNRPVTVTFYDYEGNELEQFPNVMLISFNTHFVWLQYKDETDMVTIFEFKSFDTKEMK